MINHKITCQIIEKLQERFSLPISICDLSGRTIASTEPSCIGEMNLLAIESLNLNAKVTTAPGTYFQNASTAVPLRLQGSRIGAVVIEPSSSANLHMAELLGNTIELLYEELLSFQKRQNQSQERSQFLFECLHQQAPYTENFIKRGEFFGIQLKGKQTLILMERKTDDQFTSISMLQNLLDEHDIILPLSENQVLLVLKENVTFEKKYHRILSAAADCHMGICSGEMHLNTVYQAALESLKLGKALFPDEHLHSYDKMKLAIALSKTAVPGLEQEFQQLCRQGKNAQLAETAVAYLRLNGDIQKICEHLHIHRNSIPYRLHRIQEICGRNLTNSYDMLCLYASYICHIKKQIQEKS